MMKISLTGRFQTWAAALICLVAVSSLANADDRFAIVVGAHDNLVIFGSKGERVAELPVATTGQPVTVGDVSFQVSYGSDANGRLTAIVAPSADAPADLHFSVLGKSVDADRAVVTLIFSTNLRHVTVNAGYGGRVEVNSHRVMPSEPMP
jgi:hypothetical protein